MTSRQPIGEREAIRHAAAVVGKLCTVKKAARNSDVDIGGVNQTTRLSEISYSHVLWFCATIVNIGIWRILTWLFLQCGPTLRKS
jgi:hypothetical protein